MLKLIRLATLSSVITLLPFAATLASADPVKVVASFSIIGDFARNVGGDRIELTTLVGPDGDAHVYEPKPADAAAMTGADVVLVNGLHFEGFLKRLAEASATRAAIVELTKGIEPIDMKQDHEGGHAEAEAGDSRRHRSACFSVDRQCQDLCKEHRRRVVRRRRRVLHDLPGECRRL